LAGLACLLLSGPAPASPILAGFNSNSLGNTDDGSVGPVSLGFTVNFGGAFSSVYINNNGNLTFGSSLSAYTPFPLSAAATPIIAPFFADVDTRLTNSVTYGSGTVDGHAAFGVNWPGVGAYNQHTTPLNDFQAVLIDRHDTGAGNFDIEFNYGSIGWDTGDLSNVSARVGYADGSGSPGSSFELPGSAVSGAFLDGGPNALISGSQGSNVPGRYLFAIRNAQPAAGLPEPATVVLGGTGILLLAARAWRRRAG
jgi:hypothetical protein